MKSKSLSVLCVVLVVSWGVLPCSAGPYNGPCYQLVFQPPGGTQGSCGPCTEPFAADPYCAGTGTVNTFTVGYTISVVAKPGIPGTTACSATWKVVGRSEPCVMGPNATQIAFCLTDGTLCTYACEACLVPGAGWLACAGCAYCLIDYGVNCTGCSIRVCYVDTASPTALQRLDKSAAGVPCVGT